MGIEELWYEASPYVYVLAGLALALAVPGWIATIGGVLLMIAGGSILRMRWSYRKRLADATEMIAKLNSRPPAGDESGKAP